MESNEEPCSAHKQHEIPYQSYNWDKFTDLIRPEVTPLYNGCTEGCRKIMTEQYKSLIKLARIGIKYYKYQTIPETKESLSFPEFVVYCHSGELPEDEFIETHLDHVMREDKFVPKEEDENSEEEESSDNNNEKQEEQDNKYKNN